MSAIRINELARELEVKSKAIIDYLREIGVTDKRSDWSALDEDIANKVSEHFHAPSREAHNQDRVATSREQQLRAQIAELEAQLVAMAKEPTFKVSDKGEVSVCRLGNFSLMLYAEEWKLVMVRKIGEGVFRKFALYPEDEEWKRLFELIPGLERLRRFIAANRDALATRAALTAQLGGQMSGHLALRHPQSNGNVETGPTQGAEADPDIADADMVEAPDGWNNLDATKGMGYPARESGRYGSHPSHDGFDDESEP